MAANYSSDEEEDDSQNLVTCDNCLEYEGYIKDPRTLPCQHVFCVPCLDGQRRNPKKLFCAHKDCLREHDVTIDDLPSALGELKMCCDTCAKKKGEMFMTASVYCVPCGMKYCNDHHKVHDELNTHTMMRIKEFLQSSFAHELRYCHNHKQEVCSMGCPDCSKIFCVECINTLGVCQDGSPHGLKLVSLKKFSEDIKGSLESLKIKVEDKFDDISVVIKETTITLSEWDIETEESVRLIRRTRDEQLDAIRVRYELIEDDFMRSRKSSKEKITDYLAEKAAVIQSEYLTQLKKLRTDITYRHPVDLVCERAEIDQKIAELMKEDFPRLVLQNQVKPFKKDALKLHKEEMMVYDISTQKEESDDEKREMEIELLSIDEVIIGGHITLPPITPPTGLQLVRQVTVGGWCSTVCQYKGYTYVGLDIGGVDRIDDQGNVTSKFIEAVDPVVTVRAHNDRLYTLVGGQPRKLCVYDLTGQLITSWNHADTNTMVGSGISIVRDQVAIVDVANQRITLYTPNGDMIRHVSNSFMSKNDVVTMCEAGDECVILTINTPSNKVFRQNLISGKVEWESTHVLGPISAVCYGRQYVLVTSGNTKTFRILNVTNGELVSELTESNTRGFGGTYDLFADGDILIVPRRVDKCVLYYKLQT